MSNWMSLVPERRFSRGRRRNKTQTYARLLRPDGEKGHPSDSSRKGGGELCSLRSLHSFPLGRSVRLGPHTACPPSRWWCPYSTFAVSPCLDRIPHRGIGRLGLRSPPPETVLVCGATPHLELGQRVVAGSGKAASCSLTCRAVALEIEDQNLCRISPLSRLCHLLCKL